MEGKREGGCWNLVKTNEFILGLPNWIALNPITLASTGIHASHFIPVNVY